MALTRRCRAKYGFHQGGSARARRREFVVFEARKLSRSAANPLALGASASERGEGDG